MTFKIHKVNHYQQLTKVLSSILTNKPDFPHLFATEPKKSGRFLSDGSTCILRTTSISNRYKYQLERRSYDLMRKIYTFLFRNEPLFNQTLSLSMIDNVLPFESLR